MDFDVVLEEIGEFGKFQLTNYLLICLPVLYGAANSLSYVFTARPPHYRCLVPECDSADPIFDEDWVPKILPGKVLESSGQFSPEVCSKYSSNNDTALASNSSCNPLHFTHDIERCDQWVFDPNERTIVTDV